MRGKKNYTSTVGDAPAAGIQSCFCMCLAELPTISLLLNKVAMKTADKKNPPAIGTPKN